MQWTVAAKVEEVGKIYWNADGSRAVQASRPYSYDELHPRVAFEVSERWKRPCEAMFKYLAAYYPPQLLRLLGSTRLSNADLTFAAEIAGSIDDSESVRAALLPLLKHADSVVREGAIYGLAEHLDGPTRARLRRLAENDPSPAVRTVARDALNS